jgi:hypothetical protein
MKHYFSKGSYTIGLLMALFFTFSVVHEANAQFFRFGKNRVQYEDFEWRFIQTEHFDIFYYGEKNYDLARFTADYLEPSLKQLSDDFGHEINDRIKVIIYDSHNDFDQTNVIPLPIDTEGIGGVTDKYKNRMTIPFQGDYGDFATTTHHELVHAFVNDMFYGGTISSIIANNIQLVLPLWFEEGLAEYTSNGWDTNTDMFIRDAIINNYLPPIQQLGGYLSYRGGQAMWNYIVEEYGRAKITELMQNIRTLRSVSAAYQSSFGMTIDEFSERMMNSLKKRYLPEIANRQSITEISTLITKRGLFGTYNTSPVISPAGDKLAMITNEGNRFNVVVLSTVTGRKLKTLINGSNNEEFEELNILDPNLTWSPDGRFIALSTKSKGKDDLAIVNYESGVVTKIRLEELDAIGSVSWSPDGRKLAFDANAGGYQDIFVYDFENKSYSNITRDLFSDRDPSWSYDSKYVLFTSNRGDFAEVDTYKTSFSYFTNESLFQKDLYKLEPGQKSTIRLTNSPIWDETNANGLSNGDIVFVSDKNGIPNIYRMDSEGNNSRPLTDLQIGVRQLSVSMDGSRIAVNTYNKGYLDVFLIKAPLLKERETELEDSYWAKRRLEESDAKRVPAMGYVFEEFSAKEAVEKDAFAVIEGSAETTDKKTKPDNPDKASSGKLKSIGDNDVLEKDKKPTTASNVIDFRNYVFSDEVLEDSVIIALNVDVFNPDAMRNESGQYLPRPYRLTFSPDITYANANLSTFGSFGLAQFTYSDLLGDHQITFASNLQLDLRVSDYVVQYGYYKNRWNFLANFFHTARQFQTFNGELFRLRNYGGGLTASYPFDKFKRVDFTANVVGISRDLSTVIGNARPENESAAFFYPSVTYTRDYTEQGYLSPSGGSRMAVSFSASPPIPGTDVIQFGTLMGDYRKYIGLGYTYSLAFRASGGTSFGGDSNTFFMGGVQNWINLQWKNSNIPIDRIESTFFALPALPMRGHLLNGVSGNTFGLINAEFRFPLVAALLPGPIPIVALYNLSGVAFFDIGAAWGFNRDFNFTTRIADQRNPENVINIDLPITSVGSQFDPSFNVDRSLFLRFNALNPEVSEIVEDPLLFTLPDMEGDEFFTEEITYDVGSILAGAGFGLRTIVFGFPVRWDIAWPYRGNQGFGQRINYLSIGVDF